MLRAVWTALVAAVSLTAAYRYDPLYADFNINTNQTATNVLDYDGTWSPHTFHPSPDNWRFPFYTLFLDRFVNGDPSNDDFNGTFFEHDMMSTQLRHGGDVQGLIDTLDYLAGMGIKGLYLAGSVMINLPWSSDGYAPVDFSLLDGHFANIDLWRTAVTEIHNRGMYVIFDNTVSTMGDLIGFQGYLNVSTPFTLKEHPAEWKDTRRYLDFAFSNDYVAECNYPRFWRETGVLLDPSVTNQMKGCYNSDFDQYGDTDAFGDFPDWQRQLSKFESVQDRLREWDPRVLAKINRFACMVVEALDIDGYRLDKSTQVTVDALSEWSSSVRTCAKALGKDNFFIAGEITGQNTFGSIYLGRGRQPDQYPKNTSTALSLQNTPYNDTTEFFIRPYQQGALDGAAFHYTVYRYLTQFLGQYAYIVPAFDAPANWVDQWNTYLMTNDFINSNNGNFDPRHMYGVTNQDVFRWPAIKDGTAKWMLGAFIVTIHMPGIPLLLWGEEQEFYVLDNTASNYVFGRQAMSSAQAWQNHGCYTLGATTYFTFPTEKAVNGCTDALVSLDHRDPSHPIRNFLKSMYQMRENYPVLKDGWYLEQLSNHTQINHVGPIWNFTAEQGLWSVVRSRFEQYQNFTAGQGNTEVWLLYTNQNTSTSLTFDCQTTNQQLLSPFPGGTTVKNLFYPFDELTLVNSNVQNVRDNPSAHNGV